MRGTLKKVAKYNFQRKYFDIASGSKKAMNYFKVCSTLTSSFINLFFRTLTPDSLMLGVLNFKNTLSDHLTAYVWYFYLSLSVMGTKKWILTTVKLDAKGWYIPARGPGICDES